MRDPNRIKPFLETIEKCWEQVPDWRFGQLIENLKRRLDIKDLFYIEDEELEEEIKNIFKTNKGRE